jgi:hypothetical protein
MNVPRYDCVCQTLSLLMPEHGNACPKQETDPTRLRCLRDSAGILIVLAVVLHGLATLCRGWVRSRQRLCFRRGDRRHRAVAHSVLCNASNSACASASNIRLWPALKSGMHGAELHARVSPPLLRAFDVQFELSFVQLLPVSDSHRCVLLWHAVNGRCRRGKDPCPHHTSGYTRAFIRSALCDSAFVKQSCVQPVLLNFGSRRVGLRLTYTRSRRDGVRCWQLVPHC